jgi:hypothetical protein
LREVVAFEQQRFARCLGKSVGKAIAEIEAGLVPPLAEVEKGLTSQFTMFDRDWLDDDAGTPEEGFGLAVPSRPSWLSMTIDNST